MPRLSMVSDTAQCHNVKILPTRRSLRTGGSPTTSPSLMPPSRRVRLCQMRVHSFSRSVFLAQLLSCRLTMPSCSSAPSSDSNHNIIMLSTHLACNILRDVYSLCTLTTCRLDTMSYDARRDHVIARRSIQERYPLSVLTPSFILGYLLDTQLSSINLVQ